MKKIALGLFLLCLCVASAGANSLFITTILDCTTEKVQDVAIEIMTGKNFIIDEVSPYKIVFEKNFGDGFFVGKHMRKVQINVLARDGNVKLMVANYAALGDAFKMQVGVDHVIPLIKEIKHAIDGTAISLIENEAVDQLPGSGNVREKKLGLSIGEKDSAGLYRVRDVEAGSFAAEAGIYIGDIIHEMNGRYLSDMGKRAVESYLSNKWGSGASVVLVVEHDGQKKTIILKKKPE